MLGVVSAGLTLAAGAAHWAFEAPRSVEPPAVQLASWPKTSIDRFILARLEAERLTPAPPAPPEQLIRRVTLGLTGLPPTPEEVAAFADDSSASSYEQIVDRLLASAHYGERWARHWLDLARYAETDGFEHDAVRAHSWRYRDYVITSLNDDKPYDQFIREQLAGDELWPDQPDSLIATGFNLLGPDMVDSADQVQRRLNTLNDMTDTACSVFLAQTMGCARCHDHKSEPFTQRDYFGVQAFFAAAEFRREHPVATRNQRKEHELAMAEYDRKTKTYHAQITALEAPFRETLFTEKLARLSEDVQLAHRTPREQRTAEQEGTVQETLLQVKVTNMEVLERLPPDVRAHRASLETEIQKIPRPVELPRAMVLQNSQKMVAKTRVLARGDYNNPQEEVQPGFPAVLTSANTPSPALVSRRALADWIASPENPLTARVMVNRIWQHHFGRGLVATPSDFGTHGDTPSHPELLDWLAREFIRCGWKLKHIHRLIVLSAVYQQSTRATPATLAIDPQNKLLSKQSRLRLEGEVIRDSLLAVSGRLNDRMGGPGVLPQMPSGVAKTLNWNVTADPGERLRRSIYVFSRRNLRFPFFEVFDAPDTNLSCPERGRSTTAPQALTLLNSDDVVQAAESTAKRIALQAGTRDLQVLLAYRMILGRTPTSTESRISKDFLESAPLRELCRALFNLNAFVYVD